MTNEREKIKNLWRGSQHRSESASSSLKGGGCPELHMEGFGKIVEGWYCSSQERRLSGGSEAPRFFCLIMTYPRPAHPVTYQSYPPCFMSQGRDIWLSRPSREEIQHLRLW